MQVTIYEKTTNGVRYSCDIQENGQSYGKSLGQAVLNASSDGVDLRNCKLPRVILNNADLRGVDFSGSFMQGSHFIGANLSEAKFYNTNLTVTNFTSACCVMTDFDRANFSRANCVFADFNSASFKGSNLFFALFDRAILPYANFTGACLDATSFDGAFLHEDTMANAEIGDHVIQFLIARVYRLISPYEFFFYQTDDGILVRAGCRTMMIEEYYTHIEAEYGSSAKIKETLAILKYAEARLADMQSQN